MPAERITMRQAREIIRLKATSISAHEISRRLRMARSTVRAVSTLTPWAACWRVPSRNRRIGRAWREGKALRV